VLRRKEGKEGRGKCADQIGERKRGSALPEGFAPGEGNPQEKSRGNRKIRLKIGIAKAFGG